MRDMEFQIVEEMELEKALMSKSLDVIAYVSAALNISKTKARQLLNEGAIKVNGVKITQPYIVGSGIMKIGKRYFFKLPKHEIPPPSQQ